MDRSISETEALTAVLRRHLRLHGWTARKLAAALGVGEATVKRWLTGRALTLDRLERLAGLCALSLAELAIEARQPPPAQSQELTLAQEKALAVNPLLSFLFITILGGFPPDEVAQDFHLPARVVEAALLRLERLALIDRLPGGRARARIDRTVIWSKPPMRALFEQRMKSQFTEIDYASAEALYTSELVKLSPSGIGQLAELIELYRREVQSLCERDRRESHLPGQWYATLCVARPLAPEGVERLADEA